MNRPRRKRKNQTRVIYKARWECLRAGLWRSECGWHVMQRAGRGLWVGTDLGDSEVTLYGDCMESVVYQFMRRREKA
jgi:hypothetical protein